MRVLASIQARMSSSRLPGKVLKIINGKPMLFWQINQLRNSKLINEVVIATTKNEADDQIVEFCIQNKIKFFRGDEDDVLQRISDMLSTYKFDIHVESYGDSPLIDPILIDSFIYKLLKNYSSVDLVTNAIETTYPPGSEFSVYKSQILKDVNTIVQKKDKLREHVALNIYKRNNLFSILSIKAPKRLHYPDFYIEVDTQEDFDVVSFLINELIKEEKKFFHLKDIISIMKKNKHIVQRNQNVTRRWKKFRNGF